MSTDLTKPVFRQLRFQKRFRTAFRGRKWMLNLTNPFRTGEDGAVTVDWVVLTAAVIALFVLLFNIVATGASDLGTEIETELSDVEVIDIG
jgi:hypothetical protein